MADAERMTIASADDNARRATLPSNDSEKAQPWQPIPVENSPFHQEPGMWSGQRHSRHLPIRPSITLVTGGLGPPVWRVDRNRGNPKQCFGYRTWNSPKPRFSTLYLLRVPRNPTATRSTNSSAGTARNHDWPSTGPLYSGIDFPGAEQPRSLHHQCAVDRRPPACVRGR